MRAMNRSGALSNARLQPTAQKLSVKPSCSLCAAAVAGSTHMWQTGSYVMPGRGGVVLGESGAGVVSITNGQYAVPLRARFA